jgi:hypothetical protein
MSTYKNTSGDLIMTGNSGLATLTVNYANTIFTGNLTYTGNLTTVDDFIVVAANNTGTITDMGLLAQTGPTTFAGFRYDTANAAWQVSNSVYANGAPNAQAYSTLATAAAASVAGANTQIQFNQANSFGASSSLTFDYANNKLTLQGYEVLGNIGTTPGIPSNAVAIYNNTIGGGGTGLYVRSSSVNDELVSKSKAIVFGIIF